MREPEPVFAGFDRGGVGDLTYFVMPGATRYLFEGGIRTIKITLCIDSGSGAGKTASVGLIKTRRSWRDAAHLAGIY